MGSINLAVMVREGAFGLEVDWELLNKTVESAVWFLDNVIDANLYPVSSIEEITKANRKIGLGVMGFADLLLRLLIPYESSEAVELACAIMERVQSQGQIASEKLANKRGPFPNYVGSTLEKEGIKRRNATITTIAPTGTISIIAGCSSGIEPLFALSYTRTVMDSDRLLEVHPGVQDLLKKQDLYQDSLMDTIARTGSAAGLDLPEQTKKVLRTALEVSPFGHIRMQAAFQEYTDNAVSKTVNFPITATEEDVAEVFRLAFELGCKGITVYRSGSREEEVLTVGQTQKDLTKHTPRKRVTVTKGQTERVKTGCGTLYVTINEDEFGICEVFTTIGKAGGCAAAFSEANARLISLSLRSGVEPSQLSRQLRGIRCPHPMWQEGKLRLSCPDAIAQVIERYLGEQGDVLPPAPSSLAAEGACPECGGGLRQESGCSVCIACGYSRCS